ncbi:MAG TPA: chromate transporter [Noviherbaspirillum sp.]
MNPVLPLNLGWSDWFNLFLHFLSLSLLSVGGAISTVPEMQRFLVERQHWLTDTQFTGSISVAQAAPGPNVLFVALMGWNVGLNAGSMWFGLLGVFAAMTGILLPSTCLTYMTAQWGHRNRELRAVRAFKQGMGPAVVGLMISTGWILASANSNAERDWPLWVLTFVCTVLVWRTRLHLLWMLGAGAIVGALLA